MRNRLIITAQTSSRNLTRSIRKVNKNIWKKTIVEFCGMKFDGYYLYVGMDTRAKNVEKLFESVRKLANS
jgi:hypothetical protein